MWQRITALAFLVLGMFVVGELIANFFHYRGLVAAMPNAGQEFVLYRDVKQIYGTLSRFSLVAFIGASVQGGL